MIRFEFELDLRLEQRLYDVLQRFRDSLEPSGDVDGWIDDIRMIEQALYAGRVCDSSVPALGRWVRSSRVLPRVDLTTLRSDRVLLRWPGALAKAGYLDLKGEPAWVRADGVTRHPIEEVPEWMLLEER